MTDTTINSYSRQIVEEDDIEAVAAALRGDYLTTGPSVELFERRLAEFVNAPYAVACSSGTAALHLACMALGADENICGVVPAITFVATANALRYCGAEVLFADVDARTGLSGVEQFAEAVERNSGRHPQILLPVHLNGQCINPAQLWEFAQGQEMRIIEDACHALGSDYLDSDGQKHKVGACRHSDMAVFSFHPVKAIATGEGGAVTTRDPQLYDRLRSLRNHGLERDPQRFVATEIESRFAADVHAPWYYEMTTPGYNYRLSDIHAALGASQMQKLDRFVGRRRELAELYDSRLQKLAPRITPVRSIEDCTHAYHLYAVLLNLEGLNLTRATMVEQLQERGVGTQVHYLPVPEQPYYRNRYGAFEYPGAWRYYQAVVSLPLHAGMAPEDVDQVVATLTELFT
jgi:UDP-4-amino-4,6-dideoxy-N-acetyl-beta-L-altrosamine transaminase